VTLDVVNQRVTSLHPCQAGEERVLAPITLQQEPTHLCIVELSLAVAAPAPIAAVDHVGSRGRWGNLDDQDRPGVIVGMDQCRLDGGRKRWVDPSRGHLGNPVGESGSVTADDLEVSVAHPVDE